jgi:hypothetical protein
MFSIAGVRASSIRVPAEAAGPRLSSKALWLSRAALAAGATGLMLAWQCATSQWTTVANHRVGAQVVCPPAWSVVAITGFGIEVAAGTQDTVPFGPRVWLERYRWYEFEVMRSFVAHRVPDQRWRDDEGLLIDEVCLWLRIVATHTQAARLGDARATVVVGPRAGGCGAAVIARLDDGFAVLHVYAPSERDLRRLWPWFERMLRSARIYTPAPPPEPGWGPPDHL